MTSCRARIIALGATIALIATACSNTPAHENELEQCVSWADLSDPQKAFNEADAVVVGQASTVTKSAKLYGIDAAVHEVEILQTLKGDIADTELVASTPEICTTGAPYPNGDPLEADGKLILFLIKPTADDPWTTITPFEGVRPLPDDGSLPFDTTTGSDQKNP